MSTLLNLDRIPMFVGTGEPLYLVTDTGCADCGAEPRRIVIDADGDALAMHAARALAHAAPRCRHDRRFFEISGPIPTGELTWRE